jgi:hypothetical protein
MTDTVVGAGDMAVTNTIVPSQFTSEGNKNKPA